jgi:hypothetical protein
MDTRHLGTIMGSIRTGVGASLVVAPAWAGRIWVGEDAGGHGTKVFARAVGARDVALGAGILAASLGGDPRQVARLVQLGTVADMADVTATLIAWRNLEGHRRWLMPLVAVGVGAAGAAVAQLVERASREESDDADDTDATTAAGIVDQQNAILEQMDGTAVMSGAADGASVGAN